MLPPDTIVRIVADATFEGLLRRRPCPFLTSTSAYNKLVRWRQENPPVENRDGWGNLSRYGAKVAWWSGVLRLPRWKLCSSPTHFSQRTREMVHPQSNHHPKGIGHPPWWPAISAGDFLLGSPVLRPPNTPSYPIDQSFNLKSSLVGFVIFTQACLAQFLA
jgi:hypothetical protein